MDKCTATLCSTGMEEGFSVEEGRKRVRRLCSSLGERWQESKLASGNGDDDVTTWKLTGVACSFGAEGLRYKEVRKSSEEKDFIINPTMI